jgi:hypothetical protein
MDIYEMVQDGTLDVPQKHGVLVKKLPFQDIPK